MRIYSESPSNFLSISMIRQKSDVMKTTSWPYFPRSLLYRYDHPYVLEFLILQKLFFKRYLEHISSNIIAVKF